MRPASLTKDLEYGKCTTASTAKHARRSTHNKAMHVQSSTAQHDTAQLVLLHADQNAMNSLVLVELLDLRDDVGLAGVRRQRHVN